MKKVIMLFSIVILFTLYLSADTQISAGNVSGIWEFIGSPFYINGEITIPNNATLNIESGVEVIFTGFYKFNVQGQLLAIGSEENLIHFTINDTTGFSNTNSSAGGWHAIRFENTPVVNDSSKIIYCKLEYGKAYGGGENSGGAIFIKNYSKVLISNSIIKNNRALFINCTGGKGAGIYCENSHIRIVNNTFRDNYVYFGDGGGIYCDYSNPVITGNTIENNTAFLTASAGGGIFCTHSNPIITNNIINMNLASGTAANGAGIYCQYNSEFIVINDNTISNNNLNGNSGYGGGIGMDHCENVTIYENILTGNKGGIHITYSNNVGITQNNINDNISFPAINVHGDSIYISDNEISNNTGIGISVDGSEAFIENNLIFGNSSTQKGAGINVSGSNIIIQNNEIIDNHSYDKGGGLYLGGANPVIIRNNIIRCNSALNRGGAIYTYSGNFTIENNLIDDNTCQNDGGAIYLCHASGEINIIKNIFTDNHSITSEGGAIYSFGGDCDPNIINNTFVGNSADNSGGAIYSNFSTCYIENSILWNNRPNEIFGGVYVTYSDIEGGFNGLGNINADPLFEDMGNGNFNLTENSPCIDTGNPNSPPDPDGTIVDMGALYFPHIAIYADFTVNTFLGPPPLTVHFTDLSHSPNTNIVAWLWDFDNNGTIDSWEQNPIYIYEEEGVYSVSLTVIGEEGDIDTELKEDYITVHIPTIINVPADQPTIQEGINVAVDGDTVLVQPDTYYENINYNGKNITVASLFLTTQDTTYISQTIIDGDSIDSVVTFESGEDSTAILIGFTITNGYSEDGGGIYCHNSNPTIEYCTFNANSSYYGGGIYCCVASPTIVNCIFNGNSAGENGGGICCFYESVSLIENCTFSGNSAMFGGGIKCWNNSSPMIKNCILSDNWADEYGGGIDCAYWCNPTIEYCTISGNSSEFGAGISSTHESNPEITNCTISENSANENGGGIWCWDNSNPILVNCIIWNDTPEEIYFGVDNYPNSITISYSDIQGGETGIVTNNNGIVNWLEGNIDADPLFVDPGNGDYHLTENSPCIDAGDPTSPLDPDGTIADMGAFYYHQGNDVDDNEIQVVEFNLSNYPNPFNPTTTINYQLPAVSKVQLSIYNIKGQLVKELVNKVLSSGEHSAIWNGRDSNDKRVGSGIYFYKLKAGDYQKVKKMVLVK
jgi:parallel beta-helix repeat protein/putative cofactor-binding repeat protein/predicted outer membrane repeat protein